MEIAHPEILFYNAHTTTSAALTHDCIFNSNRDQNRTCKQHLFRKEIPVSYLKTLTTLLFISSTLGVAAAQNNPAVAENEPTVLFDFAQGTDGWAAAPANPLAGTTAQYAGNDLQINAATDGWFGAAASSPRLPLATEKATKLLFDLTTHAQGTAQSVAVQLGSDHHWCQSPLGYVDADQHTTITIDVAKLISSVEGCQGTLPSDSGEIRGLWIYLSGGGNYELNQVRVQ